jgi:hypothetical protein
MDELVAWLGVQLDEDELIARKAAALCGCHPGAPAWSFRDGDGPDDGRIRVTDDPHPGVKRKISRRWNGSYDGLFMAEHIVRHDPARVLSEIDAKRQILQQAFEHAAKIDGEWGCCHDAEAIEAGHCEEQRPNDLPLLRLLALPYVDRPGYREEWRP